MDKLQFRVAYDGPALKDGTMNVKDLAPALLAIGEACSRTNDLLNGDRALATVHAKATFEAGSFEVALELWQSVPEALQTVLLEKALVHGQDILAILGFSVSNGGPGIVNSLLEFLKWLGERIPKKVEEKGDGTVTVEDEAGESISVNRNVYRAAGNQTIVNNVYNFVHPLNRDGIEEFKVLEGERVVASVSKEEAKLLKPRNDLDLQEPPMLVSTARRALEIVKPSFEGSLVWTLQGGPDERFTALMADPEFLARIENRERFAKGDILEVDLETESTRGAKGLVARRTIKKVHRHIVPEDTQTMLLAGAEDVEIAG